MSLLQEQYLFRRALADALVRDVIGPYADFEIIEDDPITRYSSGVLYPARSGTLDGHLDNEAQEDVSDVSNDGDVNTDPPVALANVRYPSSMGMTFAVDAAEAPEIKVHIQAARYVPVSESHEPAQTSQGQHTRRAGPKRRWQREPLTLAPVPIDVTVPNPTFRKTLADGLELFCRIRPADATGAVPITAVLVNTKVSKQGQTSRDADSFFQTGMRVTSDGPGAFVERPSQVYGENDEDILSYRLLYRHAREFGAGHGCSVMWELSEDRSDRAAVIATTFAPEYAVRAADSNPDIRLQCLRMTYLTEAPREDVVQQLELLCEGYRSWIDGREQDAKSLREEYRKTARNHLAVCRQALDRMQRGIECLSDDKVWRAFRLMNQAMLQQRARTVWLRNEARSGTPHEGDEHEWRPFQLAFLLLCLEGVAVPKSADRDLADLLWFPTGGGKTEAYLGLIAFTTFLRRLRSSDGGGITALMRYTLRLLTIQQFERAALMICCCEVLRQEHEKELGREPVSIGLWVGGDATPNRLADARTALNKLRQGIKPEKGNPVQLHSCPWCGIPLDHRNYWIATDRKRLVVSCRNLDCRFEKGLPVFLVDEDIYAYRPTLMIATVDKFAGLPWREQSGDLFNFAGGARPAQQPPELIIQDELHLISGPLGTLVGLYETAVDRLCTTSDGIRPKVIASTATIRRASQQAEGLFDREVRQFPPPGLDARDSHFAVETPPDQKGTRLYLGLMAPGTSHTTLLVRSYAALLQYSAELPGPPQVKDPYWTLVGYFNSLRVLAGAVMQVQDDVKERMALLAPDENSVRPIDNRIELTSREPSGDIPDHLKRMAQALPSSHTLDVIFATNMISVGVDINRLGLMAVMGQPQSTSEYIQSTSRVGRQHPGLVVVLFNSARSRDRSHYESFVAYHSALYRQVESTSVTPFSARSRDRGLHAVLIAMARLLDPSLRDNDDAGAIAVRRPHLEKIVEIIVERVKHAAPDEAAATLTQLNELLEAWASRAEETKSLQYWSRDVSKSLLVDAGSAETDTEDYFPTLWSLRDVDRESNLFLVH